ncbi:MAG: ABC1 kinase family protein [Candidatus Brachytrichaceae bacterium NZ_4S206]
MQVNGTSTAQNVRRWFEVQAIFLRYGFDFLVSKADLRKLRRTFGLGKASAVKANGRAEPIAQMSTPRRLRLMLEELGPTFIKLGQVVSSQSHAIPPDWLRELELLQDSVPPFPEEEVRATLIRELHEQPEYIFREFDYTPLAAASIGQVHKAILEDYESVVVKVQRPGIGPMVESDLAIMRRIAEGLESTTPWARHYGAVGVVDEFAENITKELDYCNEARNIDQLRDTLSTIRGARTPKVYWEYITPRVLTMEFINGVKIVDLAAIEAAGFDRRRLADTFVEAMVHQILIAGFFHADVHPGNVFVERKTGDIVFLDVGMTGRLSARQRTELVNLLRGVGQRDARRIAQVVMSLGDEFKPVNADALERDINRLVKRHLSGSLSQFSYARFLSELLTALSNNGIRTPSDLMFALKAIMQTEQIVRTLQPDYDISEFATKASNMVVLNQLKPATIAQSAVGLADQIVRVAPLLGDAVEQYVRDARSGRRITRLDPTDLDHITKFLSNTVNRFMLTVLLAGGMVSSVLVMSIRGEGLLSILPTVGLIGFVASLGLSLIIAAQIFWTQWRQK